MNIPWPFIHIGAAEEPRKCLKIPTNLTVKEGCRILCAFQKVRLLLNHLLPRQPNAQTTPIESFRLSGG
jgi:hypothetical protein